MSLLAVSGNELTLAAIAATFIVFALIVSMVVPRSRPDFPGEGGVRTLVLASIVFFLGTMTAVWILVPSHGAEAGVEHAAASPQAEGATEEHGASTGDEEASPEIAPTEGSETEPPAPATTSGGESAQTVKVAATEFEYALEETTFAASKYTFELDNEGTIPHDLVIEGPEIDRAATPVIAAGETATVDVALQAGTYKLYCSVPGHEDAGMRAEITVG